MTSGDRLRLFREKKGLNQTQISKVLDIPPRNWSRYETDKTSPPQGVIVNLAKLGLNVHWYMTGDGDMLGKINNYPFDEKNLHDKDNNLSSLPDVQVNDTIESSRQKPPGVPLVYEGDNELNDGIVIPLLENAASTGYGEDLDDDDVPARYVRVPRYLAKYPHLASLPVKGDSMEPTLHDGDLVVCDGGGWDGDGIYVLKTYDTAYVKRVQISSSGYEIISDNKMYKSFSESIEKLSIVGKVRAILVIVPGRRGGV